MLGVKAKNAECLSTREYSGLKNYAQKLREFHATGAHYDELHPQFPLFGGRPPKGHAYPQAWTRHQEHQEHQAGAPGSSVGGSLTLTRSYTLEVLP